MSEDRNWEKGEGAAQVSLTIIVSLELTSSLGLGRRSTAMLLLGGILRRVGDVGFVAEAEETHDGLYGD